jgi:hypothetical protein
MFTVTTIPVQCIHHPTYSVGATGLSQNNMCEVVVHVVVSLEWFLRCGKFGLALAHFTKLLYSQVYDLLQVVLSLMVAWFANRCCSKIGLIWQEDQLELALFQYH